MLGEAGEGTYWLVVLYMGSIYLRIVGTFTIMGGAIWVVYRIVRLITESTLYIKRIEAITGLVLDRDVYSHKRKEFIKWLDSNWKGL
jgi:hypothetical protein